MNTEATYTYGQLNTKQLVVDPAYQRQLKPNKVKSIADNFNPLRVNVVKVSHRGGKYYVFDGQHTTWAVKLRNGNQDTMIECKIYEGLTQEDEAELFARQFELTTRPDANSTMKALYASGDIEIVELRKAIERAGFIFDFSTTKAANRICCCKCMYKIFSKSRESDFHRLLETVKSAWHGDPDSLRREIFEGVWEFYRTYKEDVDMKTAADKFSRVSPIEVIRDGAKYKEMSGSRKYGYVLAQAYNKGNKKYKIDIKKMMEG